MHIRGLLTGQPVVSSHLDYLYIQGDLCNSDECFLGISLKLVEVQSSIIVQKKQNSMGFYLVPGVRKSIQ